MDVDEEIERAAGKTVKEIFADHGEASFRDGERKVIARLLASGPQVLATGGGALMNEETRANIRRSGVSIWVKADAALLARRVAKRSTRPLFEGRDPEAVVKELMAARHPLYARTPTSSWKAGTCRMRRWWTRSSTRWPTVRCWRCRPPLPGLPHERRTAGNCARRAWASAPTMC